MARDSQARLERESFWRRMVEGQKGSALTVRAWCGQHDLRESLFYWWRRRLAGRDREARPAAFVPVQVTAGQSATDACPGSYIEIVLPHERRVRLTGSVDRQALADVLDVLTLSPFTSPETARC